MSAAALHIPSAEGVFRPGRVIQVMALQGSGARANSQTLFGPRPTEAAKALCQQLDRSPHELRVLNVPAQGFPLQIVASNNQVLALVGVEPPTPVLAERLTEALAELAARRWFP